MNSFCTPILLIAWRRPNHLKQVIDALRKVTPIKIFVAVDGPRFGEEYEQERNLIEETKAVIQKEINWSCEVMNLYQQENLGCAIGVSNAISWFFDNVEQGIILEDDCLPSENFLFFCEKNLEKYKYHNKIFQINGISYFEKNLRITKTFYFSNYGHIWGWATWRRAWNKFSLNIIDSDKVILDSIKHLKIQSIKSYWFNIFINQRFKSVDTWDYSWQYTIFKNKGLCIYPFISLTENIGFDKHALHTISKPPYVQLINHNYKINNNCSLINFKLINNYLDYLNFNRAFRRKDMKVFKFNSILRFIRSYYFDR